jgi:pimeloyl-ACP methyl ester carboxylesterase
MTRLLLLHGGSGRRQWFDGLSALLRGEAWMVRADLPGHGESPATPGAYRLEDAAAAAAEVLEHAAATVRDGAGPCWVVGHSHGAHVGAVLAAERPDLVAGLVVGDAPMSRERMRVHLRSTSVLNRAWRGLADERLTEDEVLDGFLALEVATPEGGATTMRELFGAGHPYVREMAASLHHHDGDFLDAVLLRFEETFRRLDDDLLSRLDVPVVLLRADPSAGGLLTDGDEEFVCARARATRVERLRGVGHGLQLQDPAQVADALRRAVLSGSGGANSKQ